MTLPGVTKHLKVLEKAGLVTKGREAQWRPCKLNAEPLKDAAEWMDEYRVHMEQSPAIAWLSTSRPSLPPAEDTR
jgi:DNA-binding transcriptional ArsR family regulator